MRKTALYIAILVATISCQSDLPETSTTQDEKNSSAVITLMMPQGSKTKTRISLTQNEKNIELRWQSDDKIDLCFAQGEEESRIVKIKKGVEVTPDPQNSHIATFPLRVPEGIDASKPFDLYGVYGGKGFVEDPNKPIVVEMNLGLPTYATLKEIENNKDVMLAFKKEKFTPQTDIKTPLEFQHLGYMVCLQIKNTGTSTLTNLKKGRLFSRWPWYENANAQKGMLFDLNEMKAIKGGSCWSYFQELEEPSNNIIRPNEVKTFWKWIVPLRMYNQFFYDTKLQLYNTDGKVIAETGDKTSYQVEAWLNDKPLKPLLGKCLYLYAAWDDGTLCFTNPQFEMNAFNPLKRFATHNLGEVNTFAVGDEKTTVGKYYQWGRNMAFDIKGEEPAAVAYVTRYNDTKIWNKVFFENIVGDGTDDWFYPEPDIQEDTWGSRVLKSTNAPASYIGNNTTHKGDPCPEGYHIPNAQELVLVGSVFDGLLNGVEFGNAGSIVEESIDFLGDGTLTHCKSIYSEYYHTQPNKFKMVAKRFIGTPYRALYKYEVVFTDAGNYLKITSRPITNDNENALANDEFDGYSMDVFWEKNTKHDLIRFFPFTGARGATSPSGLAGLEIDEAAGYWSSSTSRKGHAYCFNSFGYEEKEVAKLELSEWGNKTYGFPVRCIRNKE